MGIYSSFFQILKCNVSRLHCIPEKFTGFLALQIQQSPSATTGVLGSSGKGEFHSFWPAFQTSIIIILQHSLSGSDYSLASLSIFKHMWFMSRCKQMADHVTYTISVFDLISVMCQGMNLPNDGLWCLTFHHFFLFVVHEVGPLYKEAIGGTKCPVWNA